MRTAPIGRLPFTFVLLKLYVALRVGVVVVGFGKARGSLLAHG